MSIPTLTETDNKYSFLKVMKEKESILLGINPTNKFQHELLKLIKSQNTIQNAGKGMLFTPKDTYLEQLQLDVKTAVNNLNQLLSNELTSHVPALEFDYSTKKLITVSYFINHPSEDKNYSLYLLFEELVAYSFLAIKNWYEEKDSLTKEDILNELNWQFSAKPKDEYRGKSNLFNPARKLKENKLGLILSDEMVDYISKNLISRVLESNMGVDIAGQGILIFKAGETLDTFETAEEFTNEKIINPLLEDINYKFRLEPLISEKNLYYSTETFPKKSAKFISNIAREVKTIKAQNSKNPLSFPGYLALELLIKLETLAEEKYTGLWRMDCEKVKQEFKKELITPSNKWSSLILFLNHEESYKFPPEVWKDLVNDPDLLYAKWNIPKTVVHVFTGREAGFFRTIVLGLTNLPENELWKAQALVNLIDKNQKKLRALLTDNNFTVIYSEIQKRIYTQYIPWYFRIFLVFPFSIFLDGFLENAKAKIQEEQAALTKINEKHFIKVHNEMAKEKVEKLEKAKEDIVYRSIKSTLDSFYISQKKIPTIEDIKQFYPDEDVFQKVIKKYKFKVYNFSSKGGEDADILMYPLGEGWEEKKKQLIGSLDHVVSEKNPHISVNFDKLKYERASKLLELLKK
ncbi:MAG: hypothetical protein KDK36_08665 [Leptospiraceae bacterium]|nr:hypothetical protein [Leptospiraceae bacterium]